ncbi:lysylphosphatidylglycerol synthase domain-containing protein [Streptomyces sp. NPDC051940]|uniref:lysylphosphatidylglycerol synthase transmembrane domain-containing protein n=1 Tax=Streptomyces sp. NPDC051940 TaxID=3155675 RepID=UPI0034353408
MALAPPPALRRQSLHRLLCLLPLGVIGGWVAAHWALLMAGGRELMAADRGWLLAAVVITGLCWVPICLTRQGTILERLPAGRLFASQVAAGTANHVLPAGIGAHAVTLRFLTRCGIPLARSSASLALYSLVEPVARITLLLMLVAAFPDALSLEGLAPDGTALAVVFAALAAVAAVLVAVVRSVPRIRRMVGGFLRVAMTDARAVHARPSRALALWGGAFAFPALQASVLVTVARAMDVPVPSIDVAIAYLAASVVAGGIPTPGGIGSVDAALAVALVAAGSPLTLATGAVLGFRIITAWLPLLPGALVLGVLVRRKVL